jgi:cobalt-zinc-cadmium efflux system outer membrane protein
MVILCLLCFGCTRAPHADDCRVASIINNKIDKEVHWNQGCCEDEQVYCAVQRLLQQELVVDSVVQIALLNNPEIQSIFEEIGIAQADLVEAGLFQNPVFDAYIRFPDHHSLQLNTAFSVTQSFLDIFLIPLRKKVATVELEQAYLRVANAILKLGFDVQETFYNLQAEQIKQNFLASLIQATEAANQLAVAQKQQGNINDLELQSRMNEYLESNVALAKSQVELIRLRERMNKLLGFSSSELCWRIMDDLPELPEWEIPAECLESVALTQRLDLKIARWEVEKIARMLGLKQWWAYTNFAAGISTEHEAEGFQETGPAFAGAIPIFNYGQADRARLYSMYRQSQERQKALEIEILSEVRSTRDQLFVNRNLVLTYQKELLPLQKQIVSLSQRFYNTMALSVYKLLDAKKQELQMQINYKLNLRNYWISQVELDRALGGSLYLAIESYRKSICCKIPGEIK